MSAPPGIRATNRTELARRQKTEGALWVNLSVATLVLLTFSGSLKGNPLFSWVPVDLTLGSAALVGIFVAMHALHGRRLPASIGWIAALFLTFVPACFGTAAASQYASDKSTRLMTVTLVCAVGGSVLVRTRQRFYTLLWWTLIVGALIGALAWVSPPPEVDLGRISSEGSNAIAAGRATGAGLIALGGLAAAKRIRWWLALPMGLCLLFVMLATGSRGPAVAVAASAACGIWLSSNSRKVLRNGLLTIGVCAAGWLAAKLLDPVTEKRLLLIFQQDQGTSVQVRNELWHRTTELIPSHPMGLGWGGLEWYLQPLNRYPHDIFLEALGEGGWLAGAAIVAILVVSIRRARASAVLLASVVFWTVNAMVSGDINDNRSLFAIVAIAVGATWMRPLSGATDNLEKSSGSQLPTDDRARVSSGSVARRRPN